MADFVPSEKGTTIRQPSTANLQLDSADRNAVIFPSPYTFQINKTQSLLNGFFTRIGTTEMVLEWDTPSIQKATADASNNVLVLDISGLPPQIVPLTFQNGWINTAADFYDSIVRRYNDLSGTTNTYFRFDLSGSAYNLRALAVGTNAPVAYRFQNTTLAWQAQLYGFGGYNTNYRTAREVNNPDFRLVRFLDFVSPELTYNQDLKDSTTNNYPVDVLARWYMAYDQQPTLDRYNFPIYMSYSPFILRRLFNPPKQIRWDARQPIGGLSFQVYASLYPADNFRNYPYRLFNVNQYYNTDWLMTLQVSEV